MLAGAMRIEHAWFISALLHRFVLILQFDLPGLGLPGSLFSKTEHRVTALPLTVTLGAPSGGPAQPLGAPPSPTILAMAGTAPADASTVDVPPSNAGGRSFAPAPSVPSPPQSVTLGTPRGPRAAAGRIGKITALCGEIERCGG